MLIDDIEYVIYRQTDLAATREFMHDFGLLDGPPADAALYLRDRGDAPFAYVATEGEPGFVGAGFRVTSAEALAALAARLGKPVGASERPGGGSCVIAADPEGRRLEFVHGAARAAAAAGRDAAPIRWNDAHGRNRPGVFQRPEFGPSQVQRLGHIALQSPNPHALYGWYRDMLGLRISDYAYMDDENVPIALFTHLDKGAAWTDHHTVAFVPGPPGTAHHVSFEVRDFDDLGMGGEWLRSRNRRHDWGVGRHLFGSQVYDYWFDPAGFRVEHYTDGDLVNDATPVGKIPFGPRVLHQWGPPPPDDLAAAA